MVTSLIKTAVSHQLQIARQCRHRQLFILSGAEVECVSLASELLELVELSANVVWLGEHNPDNTELVTTTNVHSLLGNEFSSVVINAFSGFECDATAALEGTIIAGGAMLLLTPRLTDWPEFTDPALQRLSALQAPFPGPHLHPDLVRTSPFLERVTDKLRNATTVLGQFGECEVSALLPLTTEVIHDNRDQNQQAGVIHTIVQHIQQENLHTLLLTADRGRGKSAALGIAVAEILHKKPDASIVICAPGKRSVNVLFRHLQTELTQRASKKPIGEYRFCPPDQLDLLTESHDMLIVDEAASIPLALLIRAANRFPHAVFASTIKGYEGAGRGFAIRFTHLLEQQTLPFRQLSLENPIRWAANDPLEEFCNDVFLLGSAPGAAPAVTLPHRLTQVTINGPVELRHDETKLRQLFELLLQAHYKTTPNDLRHLLDNRNLRSYILEFDGQVLGAALIASEGPLIELPLRHGVMTKRRRPIGHLLPQLLSQYTGAATALDLNIARVVRIAIHPECQRKGLGSHFLQTLQRQLALQGFDAIAAMFSAVPETVNFWEKNAFLSCHLGAKKQTSSGYRSITVINPLTPQAKLISALAHTLYCDSRSFHHQEGSTTKLPNLLHAQAYDSFVLQRFINGERSFVDSHAALSRAAPAVIAALGKINSIESTDYQLLNELQSPLATTDRLKRVSGLQSKKTLQSRLKSLFKKGLSLA